MKNRILRSILPICFIFSVSNSLAQENTGTRGTGPAPTVKTVSEILAAQKKSRKIHDRRENEEEENKTSIRKMNPSSPAVASFGKDAPGILPNNVTSTGNLSVHNNFLAGYIGDNGTAYYPPDCNGDISTASQIMMAVNGRLKVYTVPGATGAATTTTTASSATPLASPVLNLGIDAFFANAGLGISLITDPHVRFDRLSGRWFIIAQDKSHTAQNYLCIAVSNTIAPAALTGSSSFTFYYLQSSTGSSDPTHDWLDYPTLGIDKFALYIGANIFDNATHVTNKGSALYLVNKANLLSGTLSFTVWQYGTGAGQSGSNGITNVGMLTPQGVHNDDPNATEGYFIATDWAAFGSLILKRVSNPGGTPTLSADINLTVPTTTVPIDQPALGTTGNINTFDDRLFAAMVMKNKITGTLSLWTAHNIEVNTSGVATTGGGRNGARWYEIGTLSTTPTLIQSGTVFDNSASNPVGYYMPSMATNGQGHTLLASSESAVNRKIQVAYTTRYRGDAAGSMNTPDTVTTITSNYNPNNSLQRWGDYSQTVVDPKDNMTFWTFQEYTTNTNQWGLRAVQLIAPPPAQSPVATGVPANFCGPAVAVTITGSSTGNAGFFDPGADAGGPGYNRLAITCSNGIPVTNVSFISSTQVSCTINTNTKPSGTYTLTITNPDGQSVTANFTLSAACGTLPITLLGFSGKQEGLHNLLSWQTTHESGAGQYVVERSADGNVYSGIGLVRANNNPGSNDYQFTDLSPLSGISYYRLKMMEMDGSFRYSNVVVIKSQLSSGLITTAFPNPAGKNIQVVLNAAVNQNISLQLTDCTGREMLAKSITVMKGMNLQTLSLEQLSPGLYFLAVKDEGSNLLNTLKIIKE